MAIQAAPQVGGNLSSGTSPYFRPLPSDQQSNVTGSPQEVRNRESGQVQEPDTVLRQVSAVFSPTQAAALAARTAEAISDYPARILNRMHQPDCPSLLGKSYV